MIRKIGVLTSGGDAPGMNAAVRAVVRTALFRGIEVVGVRHGYRGLLEEDLYDMNMRSVSEILQRGGTVLYTARCEEFLQDAVQQRAKEICDAHGIEGLVVIGGDGSFRGARALCEKGVPCIGIPGTIDNDITASEYTIGFDTAMNTIVHMVDQIRDTSQSHERCSVVEVMGRRCGNLALGAGLACGALSVLVPEVPYDLERDVIARMYHTMKTGKRHFIILVAEGVGSSADVANAIFEKTGVITRTTVLGHVQRGGSPSARDRLIATEMGNRAVDLLTKGKGNRVLAVRDNRIVDLDITEALAMERPFNLPLYRMINEVSL